MILEAKKTSSPNTTEIEPPKGTQKIELVGKFSRITSGVDCWTPVRRDVKIGEFLELRFDTVFFPGGLLMSDSASVSQWIAGLKQGEDEAVRRLWVRYAAELADCARRRLANYPLGAADEEDIVQMAFHSLCRAAVAGRLHEVQDRDDLWWILLQLIHHKVVDEVRRETAAKRGNGRVQRVSEAPAGGRGTARFSFEQLIDPRPSPEYLVVMSEQLQFLMGRLRDDRTRRIAALRIEGHTIAEIARQMDVTTKTIDRKLRLIRAAWSEELMRDR